MATQFAREIGNGAAPKDALASASEQLDAELDGIENKTIMKRLKRHFEMPDDAPTPRTNAEWRQVIDNWMVLAIAPFVKLYREKPPQD